ncbi:MAG: hypothetical protein PHO34_01140 [Candidatus Omnitrophica bacterium]|nr:hypothetical protein [Candidatus Omnitrophota bacterium]MDD5042064.1 hypothetical protein [Candidatus Omnitrophota bacterium]MDD5500256.1 hypothetical protein [Candidatus Omnitrophota bacterium]
MKPRKMFLLAVCCFLSLALAGCESFVRKFTRKPKKTDQTVDMVLAPEEYKGPDMSKEEIYRQYYLFWQSWQGELENSLTQKLSLKKKVDCAQEALKNLVNMKGMLTEDMQKNLDIYINRAIDLLASIRSDIYGTDDNNNLRDAERIGREIHEGFVYPKIRNYLK